MAVNKLPVKKLIEFRRFSESRQRTFANSLKISKEITSSDGGNYWVRSISAISNAFKENNNVLVQDKLDEVSNLYNLSQRPQTKTMYQRNIDILSMYKEFDFTEWRPSTNLNFLKKPKAILEMNGLPIQIRPNHLFSFGAKGNLSVGGIWFTTWLDGFKIDDLGIYCEALHRYLSSYFSEDHIINPAACMVVDVSTKQVIGYDKVLNGEIPSLLDSTILSVKNRL